jgi:hypothetical protein
MTRKVFYWVFTGMLAAWLLVGGVFDISHNPAAIAILNTLGYPAYVATILGICKLLAVPALLYPRARFLREWAYAGVTFDALGAFISHLAVSDGIGATAAPLILLAVAACSYLLLPANYRLRSTTVDRSAISTGIPSISG